MKMAESWIRGAPRVFTGVSFVVLTAAGGEASLRRIAPLLLFYAMADGVLSIAAAARSAWTGERWGWLCVEGLAGVGGVVAIGVWPETGFATLLWIAAVWAGVTGAAAVAIGAARVGAPAVALWGVAGAVLFGVLLLARGGRPAPNLAQMRIR